VTDSEQIDCCDVSQNLRAYLAGEGAWNVRNRNVNCALRLPMEGRENNEENFIRVIGRRFGSPGGFMH